ncbi:hypothetical protein PMAYCL1PPCAC_27623, partial [Pristionchus mayeri]
KRAFDSEDSLHKNIKFGSDSSSIKEDCMSQLPGDCLLDVMRRLDKFDLEEIESLSSRLRDLSRYSHSKASVYEAYELTIAQRNADNFYFEIRCGRGKFFKNVCSTSSGLLKKTAEYNTDGHLAPAVLIVTQDQSISWKITNYATNLLNRFQFASCRFFSICIDNNFLSFFEKVTTTSAFTSFWIVRSVFDINQRGGRGRFASLLLKAKPKSLTLGFLRNSRFIKRKFLSDFVVASPLSSLTIYSENERRRLHLSAKFAGNLPNFGSLVVPDLWVDSRWLVPALIKRLSHEAPGEWRFFCFRKITGAQIQAALEGNMTLTAVNWRIFIISIDGTQHKVDIDIDFRRAGAIQCVFS